MGEEIPVQYLERLHTLLRGYGSVGSLPVGMVVPFVVRTNRYCIAFTARWGTRHSISGPYEQHARTIDSLRAENRE